MKRITSLAVVLVLIVSCSAVAQHIAGRFIYHPNIQAEAAYRAVLAQNGADGISAEISMGHFRTRVEPDRRMSELFDELVQRDPVGMHALLQAKNMTFVASSGQRFGIQ